MLFWLIVCILCIMGVGAYFVTHDEARHTKRKLQQVRERLKELEEEKKNHEAPSED